MAGGAGSRMALSGGSWPKPLVPVRGVPLIERNLYALARAGVTRVTVAVSGRADPAVAIFVTEELVRKGRVLGIRVERFDENVPLGTIGAVGSIVPAGSEAIVVNADNLTDLPLAEVMEHHRRTAAAMTVAVHSEPFRLPFARVDSEGDRIVNYREKPVLPVPVSSAVYMLGPQALALLAGPTGAPELVQRLLDRGARVTAHHHNNRWVDVNDTAAVDRAAALMAEEPDAFETWSAEPSVEVAGCLLWRGGELLLERRPTDALLYPGELDTPGGKLERGETAAAAIRRELLEELGLDLTPRLLATFDDVDVERARVVRHHVFEAFIDGKVPRALEGQALEWASTKDSGRWGRIVQRTLAWSTHA